MNCATCQKSDVEVTLHKCPICFTYNRADRTWFMSPEEFSRHVDFVVEEIPAPHRLAERGGVEAGLRTRPRRRP